MTKEEVLYQSNFGQRVAEEEGKELERYFVSTDQWTRTFAGEVDIVYGAKGSGKSAIYSLLVQRAQELLDRNILVVSAENPRGMPVFKDLQQDPPTTEPEFVGLWKLYFLSLIGSTLKEYSATGKDADNLFKTLEQSQLLETTTDISRALKKAVAYVKSVFRPSAIEGKLEIDPLSGLPKGFSGKIVFDTPKPGVDPAIVSTEQLFKLAEKALIALGATIWILIDRLDIAFADSNELEENALRALFRTYLDLGAFEHVKLKIFLRSDIWKRITDSGFREASHITKHITIEWDKNSLLNLVLRRILKNAAVCDFYRVEQNDVLSTARGQSILFYRVFPNKVEVGPNKSQTLDWMLSRTMDGTRKTAPREVIHLLNCSREKQLKFFEEGVEEPEGEALFSRPALKESLPQVSEVRLLQTLFAEYPDLKSYIERLKGEKTLQFPSTLALIWAIHEREALTIAHRLVDVGFFEHQGTKIAPSFWVPFLYRDAANMVQGTAE